MSELTEFLRARMAEDEAVVRDWQKGHTQPSASMSVPERTAWVWQDSEYSESGGIEVNPARFRAELAVKQRILGIEPEVLEQDPWFSLLMKLLAQSYISHPDFKQEWRL